MAVMAHEPASRKRKLKTALIMVAVAVAFFTGFVVQHWR
ncbi:MAG: cytochrome oxidase small assembly protein [Pseudomonas sp.]